MRHNVLIVDDEQLIRQGLRARIEYLGIDVDEMFEADNGLMALGIQEEHPIDLVITDIRMPEMDGLEETRRIRALDRSDAKTVPVIAMTANLFEEDIREYTNAGVTGVLPKPLNIDQLIETVTKKITKEGKSDG